MKHADHNGCLTSKEVTYKSMTLGGGGLLDDNVPLTLGKSLRRGLGRGVVKGGTGCVK